MNILSTSFMLFFSTQLIIFDMEDTLITHYTYQTGNIHFRGQITINLDTEGNAKLTFRQGENEEIYAARLTKEEINPLINLITEQNPCQIKLPSRAVLPDEEQVLFKIKKTEETCTLSCWTNDRWSNDTINQLMRFFQDLTRKLSAGKVK